MDYCPHRASLHGRIMHAHGMGAAASEGSAHFDTGLACLVMPARCHQGVVAAEQIAHAIGSSDQALGTAALLLAASKLGLKAITAQTSIARLDHALLLAIAQYRDGQFLILACLDQSNAFIHALKSQHPEVISLNALETRWVGMIILVRSQAATPGKCSNFGCLLIGIRDPNLFHNRKYWARSHYSESSS